MSTSSPTRPFGSGLPAFISGSSLVTQGLSLGQFVHRRAGSDDLRDHGIIDRADRLYRRRLFSVGYRG
jgi:hypothetical protein